MVLTREARLRLLHSRSLLEDSKSRLSEIALFFAWWSFRSAF
jgi:hypothetical protein